MTRQLPITRQTRVTVYRGSSVHGLTSPADPGNGGGAPLIAQLTRTAISVTEGSAPAKLQAFISSLSQQPEIIPFVVTYDGIDVADQAVRGVDFEITTADGTPIEGDYFITPSLQLRADIYIKALSDVIVEGNKLFKLRLASTNGSETSQIALGDPIECVCTILDGATLGAGLAANSYSVEEPDTGQLTRLSIPVELSGSNPGPADVTIEVSVSSATATAGQDYTLVASQVVIPQDEDSGSIEIDIIGNDAYQGPRTLLVEIYDPVGAVLEPASSTAVVTIEDDDPQSDFAVGFAENHNGIATVREGDDVDVKLRVELHDGIAASENILVDYSFEEVDDSGLQLGTDITTSTPSPLQITAPQTFVELRLRAPADAVVNPNRQFRITLDGVSGGSAQLSLRTEILGTLVDTTVPKPKLKWQTATLNVVEGGTAVKNLILDVPAPNPFTVNITRTGAAGVQDLTIGTAQFAQNATVAQVTFTAIADQENETAETATFTLQPTDDYDIFGAGLPNAGELLVTVNEAVTGGTTLEYVPTIGSGGTLVDVCTGIDPVTVDQMVPQTIDGLYADVFPIDPGRDDGLVYGMQAVAYLSSTTTGQSTLLPGDGSEARGPGYMDDPLTNWRFKIQTYCHNRSVQFAEHTVGFEDAVLVSTNRVGHYIKDETYLLRPRLASEAGTKHEYFCQILLFVVRQPNGIRVRARLCNEGYKNSELLGHFDFASQRHEITGLGHFHTLKMDLPDGMRCDYDVEQRCTAGPTFLIAQSASGKPHRFPPKRTWDMDFVFTPIGTDPARAVSILEEDGAAVAKSGPLAYYRRFWYGPRRARLPLWGANYRYGTLTGIEASKARGADYLNRVRLSILGVSRLHNNFWWRNQDMASLGAPAESDSWFEPGSAPDSYVGGAEMIYLRMGWDFNPDCWRAMKLHARMMTQAHPCGFMDIETGRQLSVQDLAATNVFPPGTQNSYPFAHHGLQGIDEAAPIWFVPKSRQPNPDPGYDKYAMRPTNRDWNAIPTAIAESLKVEFIGPPVLNPDQLSIGGSSVNSFAEADSDHLVRVNEVHHALAWSRNCSIAKYDLRKHALRSMRIWPHVNILGHNVGTVFPGFRFNTILKNQTLTLTDTLLNTAVVSGVPGQNQGGVAMVVSGGQQPFGLARTRGHGHILGSVDAAQAVCPPSDPHHAEMRSWWGSYMNNWKKICTGYGYADRAAKKTRDGYDGGGFFTQILPITPVGVGNDGHSWENPVPEHSSGSEGWQTSYGISRIFDSHQVFSRDNSFFLVEEFVKGYPLAITRVPPNGSRTPSRGQANQYVICTVGTNGQGDNLTAQEQIAPHEWPLVPGPNASGGLTGRADVRWVPMYAGTLQALIQLGDTTLRDEFLGYMKMHFGLSPAASIDALEAAVENLTNFDGDNHAGRYHCAHVSDMLGVVQFLKETL